MHYVISVMYQLLVYTIPNLFSDIWRVINVFILLYYYRVVSYFNPGAHAPPQIHFGQKLTNCVGVKTVDFLYAFAGRKGVASDDS